MPIYAYKCETCGHSKDVLRKISDPPLTLCPECGAETFTKQVTAAGFQLKGSGWYATDFRNGGAPAKAAEDGKADDTAKDSKDAKDAKSTEGAASKPAESNGATKAAPVAAAPVASPAPAAPAPPSGG